jgi:hypothetical protein
MTKGRPSKIKKFHLSSEIESLKSKGYTNLEIAREINLRHPDIDIHQSAIARYFRGETKTFRQSEPTDVELAFQNLMTDIYFNVDKLQSLTKRDRMAITRYLRTKQKWFNRCIRDMRYSAEPKDSFLTYEGFNRFLIALSNELCVDCKSRISSLADRELKRRSRID